MNESGSNSGDGDHNAGETAQSAPSMSVDDNNDETHRAVANQGDPRGGNRISGSNVESALESAQAVEVEERDGTRAEAVHSEAFNSAATGVLPPDVLATAAVTAATGDEISPRESGHQMARIFRWGWCPYVAVPNFAYLQVYLCSHACSRGTIWETTRCAGLCPTRTLCHVFNLVSCIMLRAPLL